MRKTTASLPVVAVPELAALQVAPTVGIGDDHPALHAAGNAHASRGDKSDYDFREDLVGSSYDGAAGAGREPCHLDLMRETAASLPVDAVPEHKALQVAPGWA